MISLLGAHGLSWHFMLTLATFEIYDVDMVNIKSEFNKLWSNSAPLTATTLLMLAAFIPSLAAVFVDPQEITGVPAWLKPAKFAISSAVFTGSMAWLLGYITVSPNWKRRLGSALSAAVTIEVTLIDFQAARGVTSHFNVSSTENMVIWGVMATWIGILLLSMIGVLILLGRQTFADAPWGWSLRLAMLITILGAASGGLMTRPTASQYNALAHHETVSIVGGHTVGAPDGGPGLPALNWSENHGDLRVPHFFGLHALQIVPLLFWVLRRSRRTRLKQRETRLAFATAGSYLGLVSLLIWQALRGQAISQPDETILTAFALWLGVTGVAVLWINRAAARDQVKSNTSAAAWSLF
jgi:hypothetical protein